jgi:uncharacterized membrane protein
MIPQMLYWIRIAWQVLGYSNGLIFWNLFLAFIPLAVSIWLFRFSHSTSFLWWLGFLVFWAFLPNAPYVLTDVIHLIDLIQYQFSVWIIVLVLIPQYVLFILAGFEAYVISVINLGFYLEKQGLNKYVLATELVTHLLCAIGIYLGRFDRFNSWDFVTKPHALAKSLVENFTSKFPLLVIVITFVILAVLYWLTKQVNLAIALKIQSQGRNL